MKGTKSKKLLKIRTKSIKHFLKKDIMLVNSREKKRVYNLSQFTTKFSAFVFFQWRMCLHFTFRHFIGTKQNNRRKQVVVLVSFSSYSSGAKRKVK